MTLIITELSPLGIIMAGETAYTVDSVTSQGILNERAFKGLVKVIPVPNINAGLSYWGWAKLPANDPNGVWMDWWIYNFLEQNRDRYNSIHSLAELLETELRRIVPILSEEELELQPLGNGGIHLSGFTNYEGENVPCFWHIHNGISQTLPEKDLNPLSVNANYDYPPERYLETRGAMIRNGDFESYSRFFDGYLTRYLRELNREIQVLIPLPNILSRAEFIRAQIRFISELYSVSGDITETGIQRRVRSISDEVTLLTITSDGITNYFTR